MLRLTSRIAPSLAKRSFSSATTSAGGLNFDLTEDQLAIQELARQFCRNEVMPVAAEYDRTMEYPVPVLKKMHEAGLMNGHIPSEYGGAGLGVLDCALISEEIAYGCTGISTAAEANGLAVRFFLHWELTLEASASYSRGKRCSKEKISWTHDRRAIDVCIRCH